MGTEPLPGLTPSQTVGPYLHIGLTWADGASVVPADAPGAIALTGRLLDGNGDPVPDGMVETWQADGAGRFAHPDDPRGGTVAPEPPEPPGFRGFGRSATDAGGHWRITTVKPGRVPAGDGSDQAPHVDVSVFARGLLDRVVTRLYFGDEDAANASDPVLTSVEPARRGTLVARPVEGGYELDIHLRGPSETVFFDL